LFLLDIIIMSSSFSFLQTRTLPPPLDHMVSVLCLEHVPHADYYLTATCILLTILAFLQLRAFSRPHPVPLKRLPNRPVLSILFKPDNTADSNTATPAAAAFTTTPVVDHTNNNHTTSTSSRQGSLKQRVAPSPEGSLLHRFGSRSYDDEKNEEEEEEEDIVPVTVHEDSDDEEEEEEDEDDKDTTGSAGTSHRTPETPPVLRSFDLPDSFAPLLSSSQMEILSNQLTPDLIHAVHLEASIRMREGRHEIPLDKDISRPQLIFHVPKGGCRLSAVTMVGSDGFSTDQDLDVTRKTATRSKPMVKHAGIVLDPPLPLLNVAPTLIHFPTLFEDNFVHPLRRIQIIRFFFDFIISISSFLEKCLWILESKCQIHLSKIMITPIYKGKTTNTTTNANTNTNTNTNTNNTKDDKDKDNNKQHPDWRLQFSFSGHVLLFGVLPIPFISVRMPTLIIPQVCGPFHSVFFCFVMCCVTKEWCPLSTSIGTDWPTILF
jgi:hypothetical protein